MAKKKVTRLKSSKTKRKQRTFLSLFIVAALTITIGIPLTLKLNSPKNSSQEVAAAVDTSYPPVTSLTLFQSDRTSTSPTTYCVNNTFAPIYKVKCWNNPEITRIISNASACQSPTVIAQHADSYCKTLAPSKNVTPTYNPNNPWGKISPTPTPKRSSVPAGRITSAPRVPTRAPTPAPIKGVVWE